MMDLVEELNNYIHPAPPKERPRPLEFEFAGEEFGCNPDISDMTVPRVAIYIPMGFIRKYNLATKEKNSVALPDPDELWGFLHPHLVGKGMVGRDEYRSERSVDEVIKELLEWPHSALYEYPKTRKGVILEVKAGYNPYWDGEEEEPDDSAIVSEIL